MKVIKCKVEIRLAIYHCGIHSDSSIVANGDSEYIQDVTRVQRNQMDTIETFLVTPSFQISKLKVNVTSFNSVTLAGCVTSNGDCTGTQFSDPYGTWNNVVVQTIFKMSLQEHHAAIHLNSNKIQLGSRIICTRLRVYSYVNSRAEYGKNSKKILADTLDFENCQFKVKFYF